MQFKNFKGEVTRHVIESIFTNAIQEQQYRGSNSFLVSKYTNAILEQLYRGSNSCNFLVSKYTNAIQELYRGNNSSNVN